MESQSKSSWMSSAGMRCIWKFLEGIMCWWFICAWCPGEGTEGGETWFKSVGMRLNRGFIHLFLCHLSSWAQCCSLGACGDILGDPSWTYSVWNPCRDFLHKQQRNHSPLRHSWLNVFKQLHFPVSRPENCRCSSKGFHYNKQEISYTVIIVFCKRQTYWLSICSCSHWELQIRT